MARILQLLFLFAFCLNLPFQLESQVQKEKEVDPVPLVIKGNNAFAFDLYYQLLNIKGNLFFSPYSIMESLAILYPGARESTLAEIRKVMGIRLKSEFVDEAFTTLRKAFASSRTKVDSRAGHLFQANALWLQQGTPLVPEYRKQMAKAWKENFRIIDFASSPEAASRLIDYWVKVQTQGRILDFLDKTKIDQKTKMLLGSAAYMRAPWSYAFDKRLTRPGAFFTDEGFTGSMPMMTMAANVPYKEFDRFTLVELPFNVIRQSPIQLAMYVVLPKQVDGLSTVERLLSGSQWNKWLESLELKRIIVTLPKFQIKDTLPIKTLLEKMGMGLTFSKSANFSGMTGSKELFVNDFIHKAYFSIDEIGAESAAATSVPWGVSPDPREAGPTVFRANRPFFYLIMDKTTGTVLFIGRMVRPQTG